MSNKSNDQIVENIKIGLEDIKTKVEAYCDFKELLSEEYQKALLELKKAVNNLVNYQ